jgi:cysteine synthase A
MLQFFGIEPIVNVEPQAPLENDPTTGVFKARQDGLQPDAINPGQYENNDNPEAHEKWTGPQIWQQTEGKIDIFGVGLGTTGTLIGNSRFLKSKNPAIKVVGVMRAPDNYVPGVRTENLLNVVDFAWRDHVDALEGVATETAYLTSMEMSRLGILAGPSSGLALAGLLEHLKNLKEIGELESFRRADSGEITCVFPCPDGPMAYLDEYFKYIDASHFPEITNEDVLVNKP